jgi:DUF4097 and DUF4098 domain-containing protein YvlB
MRNTMLFCSALVYSALLCGAVIPSVQAASSDARSLQQQVAADPAGEVIIENVAGSIQVLGWHRREIVAAAEVYGADLSLQVDAQHGRTQVRISGYDGFRGNLIEQGRRSAQLTVYVPEASRVDISSVSATVDCTGITGAQHLHSVSGRIHADPASGDLSASSVSGDIDLHGNGHASRFTLSSVSGQVSLVHGAGDLQASTVSGAIAAALDAAHRVQLRTTSGAISIIGSLARGASVDANTLSGGVRVREQSPTGFSYALRSLSGGLDDCFGQAAARDAVHGPGRSVSGTRGAGDAMIEIKTLSGDASICDR